MPLTSGSHLGPSEIAALLGAAGMGEVWSRGVRPQCYHHRVNSLTREVIVEALDLLADRLPPDEPRIDLIIVGGAAMVLLFGARDST